MPFMIRNTYRPSRYVRLRHKRKYEDLIWCGWDVFDCHGSVDGDLQICAVEEADVFKSDVDAIRHVIEVAQRGGDYHIEALWEVLDHDGLVNRIFWRMADPRIRSVAFPAGLYGKELK